MSVRAGAGLRMGVRAGVRAGFGAGAGCAVAALALGAAEARGQDVLVAIGGGAGGFASNPFGEALPDLENMPDPWYDLLGLEGAVDLELPLSSIEFAPPRHPIVAGGGALPIFDEVFPPDFGDYLLPAAGSTVVQRFVVGGQPSTVLSRSGRVVVNGQQWDNWARGDSDFMVGGQIRWLLRCPADLDLDGAATLDDFLVFQNLFDRRDTAADTDGDGAWTVFDFLAYLNLFEAGCP